VFQKTPIVTAKAVIKINPTASNVEECARDYNQKLTDLLQENGNDGTFDILLLGMGPDGHTASLFPGHQALTAVHDVNLLVTHVRDSPKPPPERVTLTMPTINRAKHVFIVAMGEAKATIVEDVLERDQCGGDKKYPIGQVKPKHLHWYLDNKAASQLKQQ